MPTILVVDDTPVERVAVGRMLEAIDDFQILHAEDGKQALEIATREMPDLVLTDLNMPEMDGLQLVQEIRARLPMIPVVVMTAYGSEKIAIQALKRGAANYVPKANLAAELQDVIDAVLASASDQRLQRRLFTELAEASTRFRIENDIALIPAIVGHFRESLARFGLFDETTRTRINVALREALMNAIVHGNLEVCSKLREDNLDEYYRLISTRKSEPPYLERRVEVTAIETLSEVRYTIRDEGPGFNPLAIPDPTSPENMEKASGRGLLLISTFMDSVQHNAQGNEISMSKRVAPAR